MSDDLVEFLRERLDEDEAAASIEARGWETGSRYEGQPLAWVQHVQRWPVDRVLAEVDAKRQIVELHAESHECINSGGEATLNDTDWPCPTLRTLALPYAGHPAYWPEWRP